MIRISSASLLRVKYWIREVIRYIDETRSIRELVRLMQVRLALSRVGRWACPTPCVRDVAVRSLGGRVRLRSHTTDIAVLSELVVSNGYGAVAELIPAPDTILDLGANTGLAARWLLHCWPEARLVAVEPEPGNIEVLQSNLAGTSVQVLAVAAGGCERHAALGTRTGEFGYTIVEPPTGATVQVPVVTIPTILEMGGMTDIGLLKADIEGAEAELFADCSDWIHRVSAFVVECHNGYTAQDLLADCNRGGVKFQLLDLDVKPEWGFEVAIGVRAPR